MLYADNGSESSKYFVCYFFFSQLDCSDQRKFVVVHICIVICNQREVFLQIKSMFIYIININKYGLLFQRSSSSLTSCAAFFDDIDNLIVYVWWFYYVTDPCMRSLITDPSSDIRIIRRWDEFAWESRSLKRVQNMCMTAHGQTLSTIWINHAFLVKIKVDDNWRCFFSVTDAYSKVSVSSCSRHRLKYDIVSDTHDVPNTHVHQESIPTSFFSGRTVSVSWRSILVSCFVSAEISANTGITNDGPVSEKDTWVSQFRVPRLIFVFTVCKFSMKLLSTSLMIPNTIRWTSVPIPYTYLLTLKIRYLILEAVIRALQFWSVRAWSLGVRSLTPLRWSGMSG